MKPASAGDEGGQVVPAVFRAALAAMLPGVPAAIEPLRWTASAGKPRKR
jgi:hypothetical protein